MNALKKQYNEEIVPAAKKVSTICKGKWPDGYIVPSVYTDGEFTAEDNVYAYLFYDIKIKIPKGWRYDTYKIHTKATDCAAFLDFVPPGSSLSAQCYLCFCVLSIALFHQHIVEPFFICFVFSDTV